MNVGLAHNPYEDPIIEDPDGYESDWYENSESVGMLVEWFLNDVRYDPDWTDASAYSQVREMVTCPRHYDDLYRQMLGEDAA